MLKHFFRWLHLRRQKRINFSYVPSTDAESRSKYSFAGYLGQSSFGRNNFGKYQNLYARRKRIFWFVATPLILFFLWWSFESIRALGILN